MLSLRLILKVNRERIPNKALNVRFSHTKLGINLATKTGMDLKQVVTKLQTLCPEYLAENWDNVGLLVEPSSPHIVQQMILTNDLTEPVLDEALTQHRASMILSYHPPLFTPVKKLSCKTWKDRILIKCLENRIAIYSPHTSLDVISNGITDWLLSAFDVCNAQPITISPYSQCGLTHKLKIKFPNSFPDSEVNILKDKVDALANENNPDANVNVKVRSSNNKFSSMGIECNEYMADKTLMLLKDFPELLQSTEIYQGSKAQLPGCGLGRKGHLTTAISLRAAIQSVKELVGLKELRVAIGFGKNLDSEIKTVAVCCGSGASVLRGTQADLYLTGEMSHHELLDAVSNGIHVLLTEHSNSERGFLKVLAPRLQELFEDKIEIIVSQVDKDPLVYL